MLEYMLLRPIEDKFWTETQKWLFADEGNQLLMVLDEAHLYRGAQGAEVALLIRRFMSRIGINATNREEKIRFILTSASFDSPAAAIDFASKLTGKPATAFQAIQGTPASVYAPLQDTPVPQLSTHRLFRHCWVLRILSISHRRTFQPLPLHVVGLIPLRLRLLRTTLVNNSFRTMFGFRLQKIWKQTVFAHLMN